ncbi:MAG: hypothetical protein LBP64_06270 [Tannerella sp.]|jgi:hypothetical protein|nr:hypothetical protein [Tannerella sp.]
MDNFEDWLYYIIFLVIGIVSYVGSAKKKNRDETVAPPPPPAYPEYEEQAPSPVPIPPGERRTSLPPVPERVKRAGGYVSLFQDEGRRVSDNTASLLSEETYEKSIADKMELNSADAFRKAVIYAEILNRKY